MVEKKLNERLRRWKIGKPSKCGPFVHYETILLLEACT